MSTVILPSLSVASIPNISPKQQSQESLNGDRNLTIAFYSINPKLIQEKPDLVEKTTRPVTAYWDQFQSAQNILTEERSGETCSYKGKVDDTKFSSSTSRGLLPKPGDNLLC